MVIGRIGYQAGDEILRKLAAGGMAEVFLAKQVGIGGFEKPVALKRIQRKLLDPIGMTASTYEQPLPDSLADRAASGHHANGRPIAGRHHTYPEMAAAGLWTTPTDLARWVAHTTACVGPRPVADAFGPPDQGRARHRARYRLHPRQIRLRCRDVRRDCLDQRAVVRHRPGGQ